MSPVPNTGNDGWAEPDSVEVICSLENTGTLPEVRVRQSHLDDWQRAKLIEVRYIENGTKQYYCFSPPTSNVAFWYMECQIKEKPEPEPVKEEVQLPANLDFSEHWGVPRPPTSGWPSPAALNFQVELVPTPTINPCNEIPLSSIATECCMENPKFMTADELRVRLETEKNYSRLLQDIIRKLYDDSPCKYDQRNQCHEHAFAIRPCPHELAKRIVDGLNYKPAHR